jgi:predicted dehydrogenase
VTLRVGVIGLGVGEQHVLAYSEHPDCEVTAICDLDPQKLERAAEENQGLRTTTDAAELIGDPDLDVISIASYDDAHFEQVRAALQAGKHVFAEKPLCTSVDQLRELRAALDESPSAHLASNLVLRSAPLYRWMREARQGGELGRVYAFDGDYLYGRLHKITDGWRSGVDDYSVMLGGGVHLVDLMLWICGERPVAVTAQGNRISTEDTEFRYLDFVAATFEFESGLVGRITANFGSVLPHQHVVRLFGTDACVLYDDRGPRISRSREAGYEAEAIELDPLPSAKGALIPDFVGSIQRGRQDGRDHSAHEFDVISVCVAADRAVTTEERFEIEYV